MEPMITIAWYNIVAIFVGILFIAAFIYIIYKDVGSGMLAGLAELFWLLVLMASIVLFYAIWGGIFWW